MALDASDLERLFNEHSTAMMRWITRQTFDGQVALDIVGETFAVAYAKRRRFKGDPEVAGGPWIYGIARNLIRDWQRSSVIESRAMRRLGLERQIASAHDIVELEDSAIDDIRDVVRGALAELSAEQRSAIQLRVVEDLSYSAVASELDISEQVARARVSRGLRALREIVALDAEEERHADGISA